MSGQRTIQFSVEFVTAANNFKKIINDLQQELTKVKPGTQIYDSIAQQLKQAQQLMKNTDFAIEKGIVRSGDIDRVVQNFDLLTGRINNIKQSLSSLTFPDLNLGHSGLGDLGRNWQLAQAELAGLIRQIEQLQNKTVGGVLGDKTAGFEGALDQNALQFYDELTQKVTAAREQVAQLQAEQAKLTQMAGTKDQIQATFDKAQKFSGYFDAMGIASGTAKNSHISAALTSDSTATRSQAEEMLRTIGLDEKSIQEITALAASRSEELIGKLKELNVAGKFQAAVSGLTEGTGGATGLRNFTQTIETELQQAKKAASQLAQIQTQISEQQTRVGTLEGQKTTLGAAINPSQITDLQTQVSNLMARIANLESQISQKHSSSAGVGKQPPYPTDDPAAKTQLGIQQQQEQLGNAIDSYTKRWIGAYAIINKISSTIKQAWSDIQNLDKAMTSIAVVTDMSVSDLWGKLNEYMDIAQQYGVTTQGVYEVSQIYYQQGLTTNEVMAATTETLKLARIAGMDYTAAADAMTVAIRSFKMEMTDAATVTDVYSKVASATASDSEELAIAMSKTASSAESVGSSFENTTAMLAVMIETTRESAQNLGSALKSIISRYGEMKIGATVDEDGEALDYNKVDTALKSIGISIKDAQGQFRDFDDVIFELSEKWDSLDKNTQRYIATIMAGNRQQSRFIALVDNWERLEEVTGIANNAEDAGLLQYSKTLDSFDAKLNQLKNSFQSFYMSLFDSDAFKGILDVLNDILEGFSKMGQFGVAVIPSLIAGFKVAFTVIKGLIVGTFSSGFAYSKTQSQLAGNFIKGIFQRTEKNKEQLTQQGANSRRLIELKVARQTGNDLVLVHQQTEGTKTAVTRKIAGARMLPGTFTLKPGQNTSSSFWKGGWKNSPKFAAASMGLNLVGAGLTTYGAYLSGKGEQEKGAWATTGGNVASYAGMGSMFGLKGAIAGGILGLLASIKGLTDAYDDQKIAAEALKKAEEKLQEANTKKAEANQEYTGLKSTLEELDRLKKARYESEEAMDDWIEANSRAKEAYSSLIVSYDEAGNIIVDLDEAEKSLAIARKKSATATKEAAIAELRRIEAEEDVAVADADAAKEALSDKNATDGAIFTQTNSYMRAELEKRGYDLDEFEGSYILNNQNGWRSDKAIQGPNGVYLTGARKVDGVNAASIRFGNDVIDLLAPFVNKRSAEAINWLLDLNDISNDTAKLWETLLTTFDSDYLTTINGSKPEDIEAFIKIVYGNDKDSAWVQEQIDAIKEGKEYDAIIQSSIQSAVGTYIDASLLGFEDITESFSNVKAYASNYVQEAFKASGETDIITWLEGAGYLRAWQNFSDAWTSVYNNLSEYQRNNVNKLMTALSEGQITLEDFSDQISQYSINSLDDLPGLKTQYLQKDSNVRSRVLRNLLGPDGTLRADNGTDLTSYENWRTSGNYADNAANLEIYNNWLRAEMREQNTRLGNFLADASLAQLEAYSSFYSQAQDSIETGLLSGIYAENQLTAVDYALNKLYNNEDFFGLSDKKRQEFAEIILTNIGAEDWYSAIIQFAQDNQIDITELSEIFNLGEGETLEGLIYENFNTRLERIKNEIISFYDKIKEYAKKQQEGYTWKESEEFLKEYQRFYKNAVWSDLFEINEQGLIVLKNFNKTMAFMSRGNIEKLKSQNDSIGALLDEDQPVQSRSGWHITSGQRTWIDASGEERTMSAGDPSQYFTLPEFLAFKTNYEGFDPTDLEKQRQIIQQVADQFNLSENLAEQIVLNWLSLDPAERTVGAYEAFMKSLLANNEELVDYFEKEEAKTLGKTSYDDFISKKYTPIKTVQETVKSISLDTLSNLVINKGMDEQYLIPKTATDANGNVTTYNDYDWEAYFSDLEEQGIINIDEYGDALINNPRLYGEYLIELLNISDQAVINDVWQTIFEQYHTQWQERQAELETLFTDYQFTDQEMAKMYAWAISKGNTRADMSMEAFAQAQGFKEIDGIWEATTPQAYYSMIAYAKSENPDLDFSDLPSWGEWATQRAAVIAEEREKAIKFLRELTNETSPERLNEAIELGLLDADQISEADLEAFKAGNKTIYELIAAQHPNGFTDPKLQAAWKIGQENYNQEVSKWLNDLFSKATLTSTELLEIWELLGAPGDDFDTWAEQGFEYDSQAGNYRITTDSYEVYAQAAAAKGATEMPSRLDFLQTLHAGEKTQTDARTSALSSLSMDATIHDLDAVYQAGLITDKEYFQAIADAAAGRKTYYESIVENVDRTNKEIDDAIQEIEATQATSALTDANNLFGDMILDNDAIKKMWLDADTDEDMFSWAEEALGVVYKNGEWIISNVAQAWAAMKSWYEKEYGDDYEAYMPVSNETEFRAMWANYQDTQDEAIINFLEGLSPESGEDILTEAVELGIATWTEINTYKQKGYDAYSTIRAIVKGKGNSEWQSTLEKSYKKYYQESFNQVEKIFSDGLFTEEELEGMWLADTDFTGSFDSWINQFTQGENAFFEKVGDGWVIKSEEAYNEMVRWIADTYGPEFVAALPSYKKLESMGIIEGKRREEDIYDFISGFDFEDVGTNDLEKAVELGIISQDELNWAIQNNVDYSILMLTAFSRMNDETAKALLAGSQARTIDNKIKEANSFVENTTWTAQEIVKVFGELPTDSVGTFEFDPASGEWRILNKTAYEEMQDWVETTYGKAYKEMLPTWEDYDNAFKFQDKKSQNSRLDLIKNITEDFSLDNLDALVEAGMLTYQHALNLWNMHGKQRWEELGRVISLQSEEEVRAFEAAMTQMRVSETKTAAGLFSDNIFTWNDLAEIWGQLYTSGLEKTDFDSWIASLGLDYTDGEFKITTEEGYNNLVQAAQKIYGEAWKELIPSADEVIAAGLLEEKTAKEDKLKFLEDLDYSEITSSNIQTAIEKGLLTSEQVRWALENNVSYEELIRMAAASDEEAAAAFNLGWYNYQQTRQETALTLLEDNLFSEEEILSMWEATRQENEDIFDWLERNQIEWTKDGYKFTQAGDGLQTLSDYASSFGLNFSPEDISQWWLKGLEKIDALTKREETNKFLSTLNTNAGYEEAVKAIELGILTREELIYGLAQGYSYWEIITSYVHQDTENIQALQKTVAQSRMNSIKQIEDLLNDNSFTSDELISIWEKANTDLDFGSWAESSGFEYKDGQWRASTEAAWRVIRDYISKEFGEETSAAYSQYINSLAYNLVAELQASDALQVEIDQADITDFIEGLTLDADLDTVQQAIELGIITAKDWQKAVAANGGEPLTSEQILSLIGGKLTPEEGRLFNKTITQLNADRMSKVNEVLQDNLFTATEVYEAWEASGDTGNWEQWAAKQDFILQADGTFKAASEEAYAAMQQYVADKFGPAYLALLPTYDEWVTSGLLEDTKETFTKKDFLEKLSVDAGIDDLQKASELLGLNFTEEQIQQVLNGTISTYELILSEMSKSGLYSQLVPHYEALARETALGSLSFGKKLTTPEEYNKAKKLLNQAAENIGADGQGYFEIIEDQITTVEEILKDGVIDLKETIGILKTSSYYDEQTNNLLTVAEAYGLTLKDFFEMSVESPAEVLKQLDLKLSDLTAEQYDTYISAYQKYQDSITKLFSGTGSAADAERLIATLNKAQSEYTWTYSDFVVTAEGIQLDREKFFEALALLKTTDYQLYTSLRETLVSSPELWGESFNSITDVLVAIEELSNSVTDGIREQNEALEEQASLYGEIYAKMSMTHTDGWDFLNHKLHGNAQNFTDWAGSVTGAFQQINSKDGIDPTKFLNMLTYMQQMGASVETLGGNFASWGDLMVQAYSAFGKATLTGSNIAIADLGISTDGMNEAMLQSVQDMAKSQIKFLDGQIAMLEGIKALQEVKGDVDISGIYNIMAKAVADYNTKNGTALKMEDIKFILGGKTYNLTQLNEAEEAWDVLYPDYKGMFAQHMGTSLSKNFGVITEGGVIEITPNGVMELQLSADGTGIVGAIDESNNHLTLIQMSLQSILSFLTSGKNPWTSVEGGEAYLKALGMPEGDHATLLKWGEGIENPFDRDIFNNYMAKRFGIKVLDDGTLDTSALIEREETTVKIGDTSYSVVGQAELGDGKTTLGYATNEVVDGRMTYAPIATTQEGKLADLKAGLSEELSDELELLSGYTIEDGNYYTTDKEGKRVLVTGDELDAAKAAAAAVETALAADGVSSHIRATYFAMTGQYDSLPGMGYKFGGEIDPEDKNSNDIAPLLATSNTELGQISSNTAEAVALLAVMAQNLDLNTPEGRAAYYAALGGPQKSDYDSSIKITTIGPNGEKIETPVNTPEQYLIDRKNWLSKQSDFSLGLINQSFVPTENWAGSDAQLATQILWERNGIPVEYAQQMLDMFWEDYVGNPEAFEDMSWIIPYITYSKIETKGPMGQKSLQWSPVGFDSDILTNPEFIRYMASTHGQELYQQTGDQPAGGSSAPRTLTQSEIAARNAWLFPEGVSGIGAGNVPAGLGFLENDNARLAWLEAAGILNDENRAKYYTTDDEGIHWAPGADGTTPAITELYGTAAFEKAFAEKTGEFLNSYVEAIDDFYDAKALTKGYTRNSDGTITGTNAEGQQVTLSSGEEYEALDSAFDTIANFDKVMTLYSSMLGVPFDPKMFLDAAGNDKILRTSEELAEAADDLATATENLEGATGNLDTSVLRLSQALLASGLLPTYAGINPEELSEWDNAVFNIPGSSEEPSQHELFDTEGILADFATRYAIADTPEVAEAVVADIRSWNGLMKDTYRLMSSISGNVLRTEDADNSSSDVAATSEYQAMLGTQETLDSVNASITTKEAEAGTLRANIAENSALLAGVRSELATVQSGIVAASEVLANPESTIQQREAALANLTDLQAREADLLRQEAGLIQTINTDRDTLTTTEGELTGLYERQASLLATLSTQQSAVAGLYNQEEADWDDYITELSSILTTLEALKKYYKDEEGNIPDWLTELINYYSAEKTRAEAEKGEVTGKESEYTTAAGSSSSAAEDAEGKKRRTVVIPDSPGTQSGASTSTKTRDEIVAEYQAIIDELIAARDYDAAGAAIDRYSAEGFIYKDAFAAQKAQWDKYREAMGLLDAGDYAAAKAIFENPEYGLDGFFDSNDQVESLKYTIKLNEVAEAYRLGDLSTFKNLLPSLAEIDQAKYADLIGVIEGFNNLINSGDYGAAFELIGTAPKQFQYDFKNGLYRKAITLNQNGEIEKALEILDLLGNFWPVDQPTTAKEFAGEIRFENNLVPEDSVVPPPENPPEDIIYANGNTYTLPQGSGGEIIITLDSEGIIKELSGTDEEGEPLKNPEIPLWLIGQSIHEIDWANIIARSETDVPFLDALTELATMLRNENSSTEGALAELASSANKAAAAMNDAASRFATTQIQVEVIGGVTAATGNVSGLALAEGNASLERLNLGARLAGKTLVGELGPELAVYDGMYHLLGQNGAEFVDLPSNAIVFNHRQTAGIIRGQVGYRGTALAEGNVDDLEGAAFAEGHITGPARAGIDQTISQLKSLRAMWQNILDMDASQLAQAGGGGGGNSLKAVTAELTEWYNLTRQIENLEQEINNLIAERENIAKDNGEAYLRNLRETQKLLQQQKLTQQILLDYQEKQLARQRDHINNHDIWSKFLTIGEDGLLQYIKGNETDDGKGALNVLEQLNKMSGKQQVDFIRELGYSYTDKDGKKLKDSELVSKFFEELQDQIDQYDELYDTVNGTKETIEGLTSDIEKINDEILENQKELEEDVYKILVDAWEKEIKALEEQKELIEKANKAYVDGLKEALSAEKDLYEKNETTEERESLQRQLSLLRRSGGSASEIADLEEQLNDTLKDEYFKNQERMIENIEDANKEQVRKLEEQITLQKEALEYQKENGVLWTEVYKVLAGTKEEILAFMQGKHTEFFSKSALQQEEMLTDWAHKIGIYTEERQYENHTKAATSIWDSNDLWNGEILKGMEDRYKGLKDNQKESLKKLFTDTYANSMINGATEDESRKLAEEEVKKYLNQAYDENGNLIEEPEPVKPSSGSTNYVSVKYAVTPAEAKAAGCSISGPSMVTVGSEKGGLKLQTANGWDLAGFSSSDSSIASYSNGAIKAYKKGSVTITAKFAPSNNPSGTKAQYHSGAVDSGTIDTVTGTLSETISNFGGFKITDGKTVLQDSGEKYKTKDLATAAAKTALSSIDKKKHPNAKYTLYGFSQGGLVDYTGLAMVHGTQSKPEAFLNASQTAQIKEALEATNGKENLLSGLHSTIDQLRSLIHNISTIDNSINSSITVAPGAVVINVDQLADSYDVEALSADIMNRMVSIASKATNRGVNRR